MKKRNTKWTADEYATLEALHAQGMSDAEIGAAMGRPRYGVRGIRIKLRLASPPLGGPQMFASAPVPVEATDAMPWSEAKVAVLAGRFERREQLFHRGDAVPDLS